MWRHDLFVLTSACTLQVDLVHCLLIVMFFGCRIFSPMLALLRLSKRCACCSWTATATHKICWSQVCVLFVARACLCVCVLVCVNLRVYIYLYVCATRAHRLTQMRVSAQNRLCAHRWTDNAREMSLFLSQSQSLHLSMPLHLSLPSPSPD